MSSSVRQTATAQIASNANTLNAVFASSVLAGSTIVVWMSSNKPGGGDVSTGMAADTAGNTYTTLDSQFLTVTAVNVAQLDLFVAVNVVGGFTTVTVTDPTADTGGPMTVVVAEVIGLSTNPKDQVSSAIETASTTPTGPSVTTLQANEMLVGYGAWAATTVITAGSEYSGIAKQTNGAVQPTQLALEFQNVSAIGSYAASFNSTVSLVSRVGILTLKDIPPTSTRLGLLGVG